MYQQLYQYLNNCLNNLVYGFCKALYVMSARHIQHKKNAFCRFIQLKTVKKFSFGRNNTHGPPQDFVRVKHEVYGLHKHSLILSLRKHRTKGNLSYSY